MNNVDELKEYVLVHARGQRIPGYEALLSRISSDAETGDGSWVAEWSHAAEALEKQGNDLAAARHYAMARFPYVNGPARQEAAQRCVQALDRWRPAGSDIEPLTVDLKEGQVRCWTSGLSAEARKPVLIVMGGIVTVKEQWAPMLTMMRRLGLAGIVTEMPGAGENTLRYEPESWQMISGILDAVADRADVSATYAIALSFSGHLALRCALDDHRIRSVITVGAPLREFFIDAAWQGKLPQVTVDTLAHLTGFPADEVIGHLGDWALTGEQLAELNIPVSYLASGRDEIIPPGDAELIRGQVRDLDLVTLDDVHGSPRHVAETQLWSMAALMRARGIRGPQSALVGLLLRGHRLRRQLARAR